MIDLAHWCIGDIERVSANLSTFIERPGNKGESLDPANDSALLTDAAHSDAERGRKIGLDEGELNVFDDIGGQAIEVTTETGQRIGVDALGALIDDFSDVQIGVGGEMGFALFQQYFEGFPLEADHTGRPILLEIE